MLCEAAWVLVRTPGPLRAFYERVRARRGAQIALVATARKLSVLFWHLLTREEDYAFERPSLTRRKLRGLELKAKDGRRSWPSGHAVGPSKIASASASSPSRSRPPTAGSSPTGSRGHREAVRARHGGAHLQVIFLVKRQQRGRDQPQNLRFSSSSPAPRQLSTKEVNFVQRALTFIRPPGRGRRGRGRASQ